MLLSQTDGTVCSEHLQHRRNVDLCMGGTDLILNSQRRIVFNVAYSIGPRQLDRSHVVAGSRYGGRIDYRVGELAQMVERSLSMREVAGSMPAFSKSFFCQRLDSVAYQYHNVLIPVAPRF
jgi:hypothetical protein